MHLSIKNGSVSIDGNVILEEVDFDIKNSEHVAVVGKNGAGKTTLLRALVDNQMFESGIGDDKFSIINLGNPKLGYLKQITFDNEDDTLLAEVRKSFKQIIDIEKKLNDYVSKMNEDSSENIIMEYTSLLDRFQNMGGYTYKKEYEVMLSKFGFTEEDKNKKISEFSGGQKTKIAFVKLLLSKPDILLLDEPTNHLDIDTIEWLEGYLKNYNKAIIIVSHDRMFLDNIVDVVYDIDYGRTIRYKGNYSYYERIKRQNYEKLLKEYDAQQKEIARLRSIFERFRYKPAKAKMAMSKLHQIERMELIEKPNKIDDKTFRTNLSEIAEPSKVVLTLKDLEIGYEKPLCKISLEILRGNKIGVIGKNGIGKSTLLKTIVGLIDSLGGTMDFGLNLNIGYFDQNMDVLDKEATLLEDFKREFPSETEPLCRSALGSFLFKGEDVFKKIGVLSGGEKVRYQLCKIFYKKPNFLILDEPTNHMDIVGKEHLETILEEYKGTLLFVSHDRYFVKKIATQLIVIGEDEVEYYPYGYEQYKEKMKGVAETDRKESVTKIKEEPKKNTYNIKKDLKRVENSIGKLEEKIKNLESMLYDSDVYNDFTKSQEISNEIKQVSEKLSNYYEEWEKLSSLVD